MKDMRIAGTGYELGVFRTPGGTYYLALPVDSSFVSASFEFPVSGQQAERLEGDPNLCRQLESRLHAMLQGRITKGQRGASDTECMAVIGELVPDNQDA